MHQNQLLVQQLFAQRPSNRHKLEPPQLRDDKEVGPETESQIGDCMVRNQHQFLERSSRARRTEESKATSHVDEQLKKCGQVGRSDGSPEQKNLDGRW